MSENTSSDKPPPPPTALIKEGRRDGAGRRLWKSIVGTTTVKYVLRPDELRILEDSCHLADRIERLEKASDGRPETVRGSQNQPVINPILAEERQCRVALSTLLAKIKLPEEHSGSGSAEQPRSVNARSAANARWGKSG